MDDKQQQLAISEWMKARQVKKPAGGKGRPRAKVPELSELAHLTVKQCQNRLYYCPQLHRYVRLYEVCAFFETGKPVTIVTRDGNDITASTLLRALAHRMEDGGLQITQIQLRDLISAQDHALEVAVDTDAVRLTPEQLRELVK